MAKARRAARKSASTTEDKAVTKAKQDHTPETRPSDSGARQPDPRSAATRASNAVEGTEIGTSAGPQEVGPTRGARRPYTEVLPGYSRTQAPVRVPTKEEEEYAEREKRAIAARKLLDEAAVEPVEVMATRIGFYNGKRQRAGSKFTVQIAKGQTLPSWVTTVEDHAKRVAAVSGQGEVGGSARRGARKSGTAAQKLETGGSVVEEPAIERKDEKDKDVL